MVLDDVADALSRTVPLLAELVEATPGEVQTVLTSTGVTLVVDPALAADGPTQAFAATLANLVVRSGMSLRFDVPLGPTRVLLPGFTAETFVEALSEATLRMFPARPVRRMEGGQFAVVLGDAASPLPPDLTVRVSARGRHAWIPPTDRASWRPANGLVALAAAGMTAMEIHKLVLLPLQPRSDTTAALLARSYPSVEIPFDLPSRVALGRLDLISAGAINQWALWTLATVEDLSVDLRIFDRDLIELSNTNRCPFAFLDNVGRAKVIAISELAPVSWVVDPIIRHFLPEDAASGSVRTIVLVGADDIVVRHWAQAARPQLLVVGATSHFEVVVSEHAPGWPCAGCVHPRSTEAPTLIPTVSFVSFWAGFLSAIRLVARAVGSSIDRNGQLTIAFPLQLTGSLDGPASFRDDCPVGHPD